MSLDFYRSSQKKLNYTRPKPITTLKVDCNSGQNDVMLFSIGLTFVHRLPGIEGDVKNVKQFVKLLVFWRVPSALQASTVNFWIPGSRVSRPKRCLLRSTFDRYHQTLCSSDCRVRLMHYMVLCNISVATLVHLSLLLQHYRHNWCRHAWRRLGWPFKGVASLEGPPGVAVHVQKFRGVIAIWKQYYFVNVSQTHLWQWIYGRAVMNHSRVALAVTSRDCPMRAATCLTSALCRYTRRAPVLNDECAELIICVRQLFLSTFSFRPYIIEVNAL